MEITFSDVQKAIKACPTRPKAVVMREATLRALEDWKFRQDLEQARKDDRMMADLGQPCEYEGKMFMARAGRPQAKAGDLFFGIPIQIDDSLALGIIRCE